MGILPRSTFQLCGQWKGRWNILQKYFILLQTENKVHFNPAHCIAALRRAATEAKHCQHEPSSQGTGESGARTKRRDGGRVYQSADSADDKIEGRASGEGRSHPSACLTPLSTGDRQDGGRASPAASAVMGCWQKTRSGWRWREMCLCFSQSNLWPCICVLCGAF